jgi:hypothetical protein
MSAIHVNSTKAGRTFVFGSSKRGKGSNKGPETSAAKPARAELAIQPKQELVLRADPKGDLLIASSLG